MHVFLKHNDDNIFFFTDIVLLWYLLNLSTHASKRNDVLPESFGASGFS